MNNLRTTLETNLIGQSHFIPPVLSAITRYNAGMCFDTRPAGSFMLLGNTGVGKTRACEQVAKALNGDVSRLLTIHCAEFTHSHEVAKLIGAPPGYLGHKESPARLGEKALNSVRADKGNLAVVLFDEIEKAHEDVFRLCLGILEKGVLTTGDNQTVKFDQTLVFFTSNLGTSGTRKGGLGYGANRVTQEGATRAALGRHFSPEFLNRIDKFITFNDLRREDLVRILKIYTDEANEKFTTRVQGRTLLKITLAPSAEDRLIELGYSTAHGARELRRVWEREVITPLASYVAECQDTTREWPVLRLEATGGRFEFIPLGMGDVLAVSLASVVGAEDMISVFAKKPGRRAK
jgi:ATP-dependent Clp protease ATP-binding subunit ClpB